MGTLETLANELNECGYRGDLIAEVLRDVYESREMIFNLLTTLKLNDGDILLLDFDFHFYPAGHIELEGLSAALTSERVRQLLCPLAEQKDIWQHFDGLPTVETVENTLQGYEKPEATIIHHSFNSIKDMNLNNLENLKDEVKELRFSDKLLPQMEQNMQKGLPEFQLHDTRAGNKGQVDFTLHFKKSGQSDFYYLNKYDVYLNKATPLEEGQKYMVLSKNEEDKPVYRSFINPHEAIDYFRNQKGDSELAAGKTPANKTTLASMEKGKINYVAKEFQKTYYAPAITHTMYVEQGKGFTSEQAANLIEGRSVYRDDLLNIGNQPYKAWVLFDTDKGKDRNNNFALRQFHDPSYGFNLKEALAEYNIKELADPKKAEKIEEAMRNGNRPLITTMQDGKEVKLHVEAVPRYGKINFFQENGKPEKREQFEINQKTSPVLEKANSKELAETRGVRM